LAFPEAFLERAPRLIYTSFAFAKEEQHLTEGKGSTMSQPWFKISLAEWSLNKTIWAGKMTNLDFPRIAKRDFGIDCVEYVDQFFADKGGDDAYFAELKKCCDDEGVTSGLIMLDTPGAYAASDKAVRETAIEKACVFMHGAAQLGCYAIRINAPGDGTPEEHAKRMIESGFRLAEYAATLNLYVLIENHGGLSSDPNWLVPIMEQVNHPNFGSLPDFGNFAPETDRYDGVKRLMPYAKAVSAKASNFSEDGLCVETDYFKMMSIVKEAGFRGYIGIESGHKDQEHEPDAIRMTHDLLKRFLSE